MGAARRRRRILLWIAGIVAIAGIALLSAVRVAGHFRLARQVERFEQLVGPLDRSAYRTIPPAGENNAGVLFLAAAIDLDLEDDERDLVFELARRPTSGWSESEAASVASMVAVRQDLLRFLDYAGRTGPGAFGEPFETAPDQIRLLDVGRFVAATARLDLRNGNVGEAIKKVAVLSRLAESFEESYSITSLLLGIYTEDLKLRIVREIVCKQSLTGDDLRRLRRSLLYNDPREINRKMMAAYIALGSRDDVDELRDMDTAPIWESLGYGSVVDLMLADAFASSVEMADALGRPYAEVDQTLARTGSGLMPNFINTAGRIAALVSTRQLAATAIDLRLRALEAGAYPDSLDLSVVGYDTSTLTGRRFRYERHGDGRATLSAPGSREVVEQNDLWIDVSPDAFGAFEWRLPAL